MSAAVADATGSEKPVKQTYFCHAQRRQKSAKTSCIYIIGLLDWQRMQRGKLGLLFLEVPRNGPPLPK